MSFPPTSNPPSPPPAAELNTVIGIHHQMSQSQNLAETHILFERSATQPMVSKPDNIDRSGTTTALNSLQPFTNYSIQVREAEDQMCVFFINLPRKNINTLITPYLGR